MNSSAISDDDGLQPVDSLQSVDPSDEAAIEVMPVVVVSRTFPARPSSIPDIRDFVRDCLARSPLSTAENRAVDQTVSRALLDAAGPTGAVEVTFRIFPDHVEVDILKAAAGAERGPAPVDAPAAVGSGPQSITPPPPRDEPPVTTPIPASFADWMSEVLDRQGLTQEAVARQLGVSVKTVSRWVGGETEPRLRDLRRIRELFGPTPFT